MLKFSGYPYLIRGQPSGGFVAGPQQPGDVTKARCNTTQGRQTPEPPIDLRDGRRGGRSFPNTSNALPREGF